MVYICDECVELCREIVEEQYEGAHSPAQCPFLTMNQVRQMASYVDLLKALTEAGKLATVDTNLLSREAAEQVVSTVADAAQRLHQYSTELLAVRDRQPPEAARRRGRSHKKGEGASGATHLKSVPTESP